jgi:myosin-1
MFNSMGQPVGAQITNYLLEKGRVVGQIRDERGFHIFYQFTKGASAAQKGEYIATSPTSMSSLTIRGIRSTRPRCVYLY